MVLDGCEFHLDNVKDLIMEHLEGLQTSMNKNFREEEEGKINKMKWVKNPFIEEI